MIQENYNLRKEEQVMYRLRKLYEQYGYHKFKMSKFEEYDFYAENRSFLSSKNILTFTGMNGKLMALKPDITLSIVKNTRADRQTSDRVYYTERVYRAGRHSGEYKEILQTGVEYIGNADSYAEMEVLLLAKKSLEAAEAEYLITLSHMGYVKGLMEEARLDETGQRNILSLIRKKNLKEIGEFCNNHQVSEEMKERLIKLAGLYGSLEQTIPVIHSLCCNKEMEEAAEELDELSRCMKAFGSDENFYIDFSIVNDMDYYNGIIFQGYIKGIPKVVLNGGRYDRLLQKFDRDADAIGFGISLDLVERFVREQTEYDVDVLLLYEKGTDAVALMKEAGKLRGQGQTVLTAQHDSGKIRYKKLIKMEERGK